MVGRVVRTSTVRKFSDDGTTVEFNLAPVAACSLITTRGSSGQGQRHADLYTETKVEEKERVG